MELRPENDCAGERLTVGRNIRLRPRICSWKGSTVQRWHEHGSRGIATVRSRLRQLLVKTLRTVKDLTCALVNCKVWKSAMALYLSVIMSCVLKWPINPISNRKPRRWSYTWQYFNFHLKQLIHDLLIFYKRYSFNKYSNSLFLITGIPYFTLYPLRVRGGEQNDYRYGNPILLSTIP
jgi:hypothetical protein